MEPLAVAEYIGIPFQPLGRDRSGLDCWGLFCLIYRERLGIELPSYLEYTDINDGQHIGSLVRKYLPDSWHEVPVGEERPGDGMVLRLQGEPMHVAIVVEPGRFIHIHRGVDTCLERYDRAAWKSRIVGFFRHREAA